MSDEYKHHVAFDAEGEVIGCTYQDPATLRDVDTQAARFEPAPAGEPCPSCERAHEIGGAVANPSRCVNCPHSRYQHDDKNALKKCTLCRCWGYKSRIRYDGELDLDHNDKPCCPFCGEDIEVHEGISYEDGGESEVECGNCDAPFKVTTSVSFSYSTEPGQTEWDKKVHKRRSDRERVEADARHLVRQAKDAAAGKEMWSPTCPNCGAERRTGRSTDDPPRPYVWDCTCGRLVGTMYADKYVGKTFKMFINKLLEKDSGEKEG